MLLPNARNTTYGANSPILSADLDALQDCIVGLKWSSHWRYVAPGLGVYSSNNVGPGGPGILQASADTANVDGAWRWELPVGTRITGLAMVALGTGVGNIDALLKVVNGATLHNIGDLTAVAAAAAWTLYTLTPIGTIYTLIAGDGIYCNCNLAKMNQSIGAIGIQVDRL